MGERTRRLHILDEAEVAALFNLPSFDDEQRAIYFSLTAQEELVLHGLHSVRSRCLFILQLGYFKHSYQFFTFTSDEVRTDLRHVQGRYFPHEFLSDVEVTKVTRLKQQQLILDLFNFRTCDAQDRRILLAKAEQAAKIITEPLYIFREMLEHLSRQRRVTPAYTSLQDIIGRALNNENARLTGLLEDRLDQTDVTVLQQLLDDSDGLHKITQLRRQPKDSSVTEMKLEVQRERDLRGVYDLMQRLRPNLGLSNESVAHYASLVDHYSVYHLKRLDRFTAYLYLLCYVRHRYQKLNDNLIISFKHHVKKFGENAEEAAKEQVYARRVEANQNLAKAAQVLALVLSDLPADTRFTEFQAQAFAILERDKLAQVGRHIADKVVFDELAFAWDYLDQKASSFKMHLRHAIKAAEFTGTLNQDPVVQAVNFLRQTFLKERSLGEVSAASFPLRHLSKQAKNYLLAEDASRPLPDRYEFHTYRLLKQGLDAGDIHCKDSVRFRSLEDDLISAERWRRNKETLLAQLELPILTMPIEEHLAKLRMQLEARLTEFNRRIAAGDNEHFKLKRRCGQNGFALRYPKSVEPDDVNHSFYTQLKQTDVRSVLEFAQTRCGFMEVFDHVLGQVARSALDNHTLTACLIAWGSNMGLGKMGDISDIGFAALATTSRNFIRLETLQAANDVMSNAVADLPLFKAFNIGDRIHSSSDGQKFETQLDTFNARYAYKYFGKRKGVVAYTVVANHVPINARVIGADEHESHYVFDGLFNNSTTIKPDIHSTDTQSALRSGYGTNELNFALLHVFGYQFAPRYKDISTKLKTSLYGFQHPSHYTDLLKPIRKLNETLIINEWDNIILRIFASLAYKSTTQSVIIGKLSSYLRANTTKRALWEYDNIIKSLYLLDYVDLPVLRQGVQAALNRGENYHQLKRAVSFANFGRLRYRTEQDQAIWNECARLITNCVIYFNSSLLTALIDAKQQRGDLQAAARLKTVSPVAWQHINFAGRYEFHTGDETIDLDDLIKHLS